MEENHKGSGPASVVTEIVIAGVLVFLILATLNYFGILPLSKSIPVLSFLPTQTKNTTQYAIPTTSTTSNTGKPLTTVALVRPVDPLKLVNNKSDFMFSPIASSSVKVAGTIRIDVELADVRSATATQGSGLMFKNNLKYEDPGYRQLHLFYYPQNKTWNLEARSKNKSQYFVLKRANTTGPNFGKFAFIINPRGKSVTMLVAGQKSKTVQLNDSLYDSGANMTMTTHVAPRSELDIYGLYYQY